MATGDALVGKKSNLEHMQSLDDRIAAVAAYVDRCVRPGVAVRVEPITDVFGGTDTLDPLDALVVSEETIKGGDIVNKARRENGLNEAKVLVCGLVGGVGPDKLSSSALRAAAASSV